jgi:hypothetical protein
LRRYSPFGTFNLEVGNGHSANYSDTCRTCPEKALCVSGRGLHSLTSKLNLRTFGNTSLLLELNLSTIGAHPRVNLGYLGDKVSLI